MGRRMKRRVLAEPIERWVAVRDARGQWVVVDGNGSQLFTHPDPLVRFQAVWLASHAPQLQAALRLLAERAHRFFTDHSWQHHKDNRLVWVAMCAVRDSAPPWEELRRIREAGGEQFEMDLGGFVPAGEHAEREAA